MKAGGAMEMEVKILELPPYIGRSEVERFFPGILKKGTLAVLASRGEGPPYIKVGRRVVYETKVLLQWLQKQGVKVKVHE